MSAADTIAWWPPLTENDRWEYRAARIEFMLESLEPLTPLEWIRVEQCRRAFAATAPHMRKITVPVVNSRAELVALMRGNPLQLRAKDKPRGPRVGHPDFIGPFNPETINAPGRIRFESDGRAYFVIHKPASEEKADGILSQLLGEDA